MGSLFSTCDKNNGNVAPKRALTVTDRDRAELGLKNSRDKLQKYKKTLETDSVDMKEKIKLLLSSNKKERALMLLKVMKLKEKKVEEVDAQLLTVLTMISQIEFATQTVTVLEALTAGTQALNELHSEYSIERVEQLLEDSKEAIAVQNEIGDLLNKHSAFSAVEETELETELDLLFNTPNQSSNSFVLPEAPSHNVVLISQNSTHTSRHTATDAKTLLSSI